MDWYLKVLKQYGDFSGRARRKEFWMFFLFDTVFRFVAAAIDPGLLAIYYLALFIPSLAVSVRRLHDVGKSGWMLLIVIIPLIGPFWLLGLMLTNSFHGINKYGVNPKLGE